jgi:hypothetical protein
VTKSFVCDTKILLVAVRYVEDVAEVEATPNEAPASRSDPYGIDDDVGDTYDDEEVKPTTKLRLESRHLESRPKASARLDLDVSVGWTSASSRGLGWRCSAALLRLG